MSSREKIDSVYDFTEKGLVEVKAWLEPWFKKESVAGDGALEWEDTGTGAGDGGSGSGIQFDLTPQTGGFLDVETTDATDAGWGMRLVADVGTLSINAADEDVEIQGGQNVEITAGNDFNVTTNGDVQIHTDQDFSVNSNGEIRLRTLGSSNLILQISGTGQIRFINLPISDPGVSGAVWNDGGTLKIS